MSEGWIILIILVVALAALAWSVNQLHKEAERRRGRKLTDEELTVGMGLFMLSPMAAWLAVLMMKDKSKKKGRKKEN